MPGYLILPFVEGFVEAAAGPVPRVSTALCLRDILGTIRARLGIVRNRYRVNPGLYCVGEAGADSPVLVTANYKLSFDSLRKELAWVSAFILVVDTRGINVWCAAGKGTFSADEVALQVSRSNLAERVNHRRLILPQLAAPGVATHTLKKKCGFSANFGPIRSADIPAFLEKGQRCDEGMRSVTFSLAERAILTPVEVSLALKPLAWVIFALLFAAGIGPDFFSLSRVSARGVPMALASLSSLLVGAIITPILLPWIPGRQFWLKGLEIGTLAAALFLGLGRHGMEEIGLAAWFIALTSYFAMNFTGATPFTSLSGVKKELPRGLAVQIVLGLAGLGLWLAAPFIGGLLR